MDENYRHCEALLRAGDKDRFLATLFAPADRRGPLFALYAFNHEIATVRERARGPMPGEIRLQWWRDVLNGERDGEVEANPVAAALRDTMARHDLPVTPLLDLVEAHAFDLYDDPMPTLAAFEGYAQKTEAAVIGEAARILAGTDATSTSAAQHAGLAVATTNVLRRLPHHASRRQLFIPLELLDQYGARIDDIYAGQATRALGTVLRALRDRARRHVTEFEAQLPSVPATAMPAFLPIALLLGYLAAMEQPGYDPFRSDPSVPQWRRQWALWRAARRYARMMRR